MNKNLPTYELRVNPDIDRLVTQIALVDEPAIESDFLAFSKEQMNLTFQANDEKMELIGAAMIPDMKIYRRDKNGTEFNVYFTADTIRTIVQLFMKRGFQQNMNLDHTAQDAKSFVFQSYIVDSKKGMTSPAGLNVPDGSWVVGVKVQDKQVWKDIKAGKRNGFSIEGVFEFFEPKAEEVDNSEAEVLSAINELNKILQKKK